MGEAIIMRSGGGSSKQPTKWRFLQAISANGNFTMEKGKWYRIHVYGKSGNGGSFDQYADKALLVIPGMGGGGSGGYACSILKAASNKVVPCTVTETITSFGSYLSATGAENVGPGVQSGSPGGEAKGGNVMNAHGFSGGNGGDARNFVNSNNVTNYGIAGAPGGNGGGNGGARASMSGGYYDDYRFLIGGGGGGGARLPDSPYTGEMGTIGAGGAGSGAMVST